MNKANNIRFFYNGLKVGKGRLERAHYSFIEEWKTASGRVIPTQISIYARDYVRFSLPIQKAFRVENNTETMVDYHEKDTIRVTPEHPRFREVAEAFLKQEARKWARGSARSTCADKVRALMAPSKPSKSPQERFMEAMGL